MSHDLLSELQTYIEAQNEKLNKCNCQPMTIADLKKYEAIQEKISSAILDVEITSTKNHVVEVEFEDGFIPSDNGIIINDDVSTDGGFEPHQNGENLDMKNASSAELSIISDLKTSFVPNIAEKVKRIRRKSKIVVENEKQQREREEAIKKRKRDREKRKKIKQEMDVDVLNEFQLEPEKWMQLQNDDVPGKDSNRIIVGYAGNNEEMILLNTDGTSSSTANVFEVVTQSIANDGLQKVRRYVQQNDIVKKPYSTISKIAPKTGGRIRKFSCKSCGANLQNMHKLLSHICDDNSGNIEQSFRCLDCDEVFDNNTKKKSHKCTKEPEVIVDDLDFDPGYNASSNTDCKSKPMKVNCIVKKSFQPLTLVRPDDVNPETKPYKCSDCGHGFCSRAYLLMHSCTQRKHKSTCGQLYKCVECVKTFSNVFALRSHMRTHTGSKPYQCRFCNRKFSQRTSLRNHERTHTGEKPFECDYCGQSFTQKVTMVHHRRTHTGEKPYECSICHVKFSIRLSLKRHLLIHTGETPYTCKLCGDRFTRRYSLTVHERNHENRTGESSAVVSVKKGLPNRGLNRKKSRRSITRDKDESVIKRCQKTKKETLKVQKTTDGICIVENKKTESVQRHSEVGLSQLSSLQTSTKVEHVIGDVIQEKRKRKKKELPPDFE